jgi:hypothetical protein
MEVEHEDAENAENRLRAQLEQLCDKYDALDSENDRDAVLCELHAVIVRTMRSLKTFAETIDGHVESHYPFFEYRERAQEHLRIMRDMCESVPIHIVYDLLILNAKPWHGLPNICGMMMTSGRTDVLQRMRRSRALGWSWHQRYDFHPAVTRWAIEALATAHNVAPDGVASLVEADTPLSPLMCSTIAAATARDDSGAFGKLVAEKETYPTPSRLDCRMLYR